ncbi:SLAP domain-containing protein [Ornithinibacillus halophilus]|uniref:SLAP domain-containing protein n=1 Tax=Ornithinibacillus halophilus TaxID=930117 RepID=A0A1M5IIW3_9BACI|nr:SLAP domain-containing protein [Ornithinibacillus halophilus]SHG28201.1 SLAP domain-containing protein [Ornithinibacillus halophilus]
MQQLQFESAWDKTIANDDREHIIQVFNKNMDLYHQSQGISFTSLRYAKNHKDDLLVIAIVHNTTNEPFIFKDQMVSYTVNHELIGEYSFSISVDHLPPKTSMPWTFIYPKGTYSLEVNKLGVLKLED